MGRNRQCHEWRALAQALGAVVVAVAVAESMAKGGGVAEGGSDGRG
ncbi:hypothetical protein HCN51_05120 [Nonomuraea sp. FMUSA5-5]|uniref:Uncharacterized protein n=1 Tax=Nonomuraea composti TaxID=2720023 RepID=A0ABX1B1I4_9ACTN|nr:hypothetical protein [Nonomuraea sp. FMUSA5-5]NJP88843.1 hypothetical protein [Nonomuraea sp. FMUSA5-5]